jgi:tRNA A-37 threonylcarbamoyl transferase component Bud32
MQSYELNKQTSAAPNILYLMDMIEPLVQQETLRIMPKKRIVYAAQWGRRQVVVKLFYRKSQAEYEAHAAKTLHTAGILTPALLYQGWDKQRIFYVLVFEKINQAEDGDTAWWSSDEIRQNEIFSQLINALAGLHIAGFIQYDLHLKNFLLNPNGVYAIDTASIVKVPNNASVGMRKSIKNLACLFAQFAPQYDVWVEKGYLIYSQARHWVYTLNELKQLKRWIGYWRKRHVCVFGKKIFRSSTALQAKQTFDSYYVYDKAYESLFLQKLLAEPEAIFQQLDTRLLKIGNTCTVALANADDKLYVIKRYNIKNKWHGIKRALQKSRAAICWHNAQCLTSWRIPTARPVAMLEKRIGYLRREAYYICEYLPGISLEDYCINANRTLQELTQIAQKIKEFFTIFQNIQASHGDMKANNILVVGSKLFLIDLDAMHFHESKKKWYNAYQKDIKRFMKNWEKLPEIAEVFLALLK